MPRIRNPYTVQPDSPVNCHHCDMLHFTYTVVFMNDTPAELAESTSFSKEEDAEDLCRRMNRAYWNGYQARMKRQYHSQSSTPPA